MSTYLKKNAYYGSSALSYRAIFAGVLITTSSLLLFLLLAVYCTTIEFSLTEDYCFSFTWPQKIFFILGTVGSFMFGAGVTGWIAQRMSFIHGWLMWALTLLVISIPLFGLLKLAMLDELLDCSGVQTRFIRAIVNSEPEEAASEFQRVMELLEEARVVEGQPLGLAAANKPCPTERPDMEDALMNWWDQVIASDRPMLSGPHKHQLELLLKTYLKLPEAQQTQLVSTIDTIYQEAFTSVKSQQQQAQQEWQALVKQKYEAVQAAIRLFILVISTSGIASFLCAGYGTRCVLKRKRSVLG